MLGLINPKPDTKDQTISRTGWLKHLIAALLYLALTILLTWPLLLNLTSAVPGDSNLDSDQNIWNLWWFKTALLDRHSNPYYTDLLYYPYWTKGLPLVFHNLQPLNGLLALPVTALGGPIMGFNFIALFAFTATAFTAYLLAFYLIKDWGAALLAGAFFSFAPLHLGYFNFSNMETMSLEWLPLYVLGLHLWIGRPDTAPSEKSDYRYLLLAALGFVANLLTNWYFVLYASMYTALWLGWQLLRYRQSWRVILRAASLLALAIGVLAGPMLWIIGSALKVSQEFVLVKGLDEEISWSAAPWSFLSSTKTNTAPPQWGIYFFGYVALMLVVCAVMRRRKIGWWWWVAGIFMVLAMGPYLKLSDSPRITETTGIPLPYLLLRQLPLVSISRIVGRFYFVADLAVALLAGYGFLNLKEWLSRRKFVSSIVLKRLVLVLPGLILVLWVGEVQTLPVLLYHPQPNPFYTNYLQNTSDHRPLLELPIPKTNEYAHTRMLNQVYTGRPIVGGYLSRPLRNYYRNEASPLRIVLTTSELNAPPLSTQDFIRPEGQLSLKELLSYYNFGYLVIYNQEFMPVQLSATLKVYQEVLGQTVYQNDQITAFVAPPPVALTTPRLYGGESWYGLETPSDEGGFRWAKNGDGYVGLLAPQAGKGRLSFQAWSFEQENEIILLVNGVETKHLRVTVAPTPYEIELDWQAGVNTLEFKTLAPGLSPGKGDDRVLTFALGQIALR
ncbi:MAG: hypothetical protein WCS37_05610 [Chloroflexota bacterium]